MPSKRRCVFGCLTDNVTIHCFPNPSKFPERFRQWVSLAGESLLNKSDTDIYARRRVCDRHFTINDRNRCSRLNARAVPSLHLTQIHVEQTAQDEDVIIAATSLDSPGITCHRFPNPKKNLELLKAWVLVAGGKLESPSDYDFYKKKVLCDVHFTDQDRNRNNRLNALAVPSLHLESKGDVNEHNSIEHEENNDTMDVQEHRATPPKESKDDVSEHNSCVGREEINSNRMELQYRETPLEDSVGKCKCCLSERELKTLWDEHEFEGETENYGKLLDECFGISWQPSNTSDLICESCISRLREAIEFRREIIATQELLEEGKGVYINVKMEQDEDNILEEEYLDDEGDFDENDDDDDDEYTPKDRPSGSRDRRRHRARTYMQYSRSALLRAVRLVWSGTMSSAEAARRCGVPKGTVLAKVNESADKEVAEAKETNSEKHYNLIGDVQKLLSFTSAIPFKTRATKYFCFYCDGQSFEDPGDLRRHTHTKHSAERITSIEQYMKPQWMNEVIKLDVQGMCCTDCSILLPNWNNMFVHFAEAHKIGFDEAYTKVIPYDLTLHLSCVLCHEDFANFGLLDAHMNLHYSNHICYKCGDTFLSTSRLEKHLLLHKTGNFPCKLCDKVFSLQKYVTKHTTLVHQPKCTTKCLYCTEKFIGPYQRHLHVTEKHPEKLKTFTCEVCGKAFTWKPYFVTHMRRRHYAEKKLKCEYCSKMFLVQHELRNHLVTHTREKNQRVFVCGECGDNFKNVSSLRKHLRSDHKA